MTSLINKIEQLIKREKTTPERKKKDDSNKTSNEILSELFGAFNAAPPEIDELPSKKSKKSKKKHKKEKKKRSRSRSCSSTDSNGSEYSRKRKKKKKTKSKKRKDRSRSRSRSRSPSCRPPTPPLKLDPDLIKVKTETDKVKPEIKVKKENTVKTEPKEEKHIDLTVNFDACPIDTSLIPLPENPVEIKVETDDLRLKLDNKKNETDNDKSKGKIQIKNLKFSTVFEETVKKAEEEARKRAEKYEDGEVTNSSSSSEKEDESNSQFPKTSDPGGILKKAAEEIKATEEKKKSKHSENSHKSSRRERSRSHKRSSSKSKRSTSRSRKSRSRSTSRRHHRSSSKYKRSRSRHRSRSRRRSRSKSRGRSRHYSTSRHRSRRSRSRESGVKLADSEKKRLLEVARRNAINMLKNGAVPAGAAVLPPHTRNQVMAAIQSGGKSVDELTDFCKHLSKKEALGELSSVSSNDNDMSENEDTIAFHHPFLVKEKAPIVMNIRGGAPLPVKNALSTVSKDELRMQFPVSSGTQHRASEWVPVSPKKDNSNMQVAKLNTKPAPSKLPIAETPKQEPLALPAPPVSSTPEYMKSFTAGTQLSTVPALPAPGPQAYPPGIEPPKVDVADIVSQKLSMIRREQEQNELANNLGFGWSANDPKLGQFTGSTGAQILTPKELASGTQAWAKKDQLVKAAPVEGGLGMHLLQKMGWTPGRGLGKEGTGTLQPLLLEVKLDTRGLQAKEETAVRYNRGAGMKAQRTGRRGPAPLVAGGKHPVSLLGEYCSKKKLGPPEYNLCFECGPDHKKNFLFRVCMIKVKVAGVEYQPAVASANKKQAKADAAQLALQKLGILP